MLRGSNILPCCRSLLLLYGRLDLMLIDLALNNSSSLHSLLLARHCLHLLPHWCKSACPSHVTPCLFAGVHRLKEMVLKWLPVTTNQAIDGEAPETGDSPIKTGG